VSAFVNDFYVPFRRRRSVSPGGRRYRTVALRFPRNQLDAARRNVRVDRSPPNLLRFSRFSTIVFGTLQIGIGIWASTFSESVINNALAIAGFSAGLLLGIFLLGISWQSIGQNAVLVGTAVGTVVLVLVSFILRDDAGRPWVAWPWMAAIGSATTFVAGSLAGWCGCFSNAKGD